MDYISQSKQKVSIDNDTPIVSVLLSIKGSFAANPFEGRNRLTRVWVKSGSSWKIAAAQQYG